MSKLEITVRFTVAEWQVSLRGAGRAGQGLASGPLALHVRSARDTSAAATTRLVKRPPAATVFGYILFKTALSSRWNDYASPHQSTVEGALLGNVLSNQ